MTNTDSQEFAPQFYNIPATIRRNAFLQGRLSFPVIARQPMRQRSDRVEQKAKSSDAPSHGGSRKSKQRARLHSQMSMSRLTRPQRKRLLSQKVTAAGCKSPMHLSAVRRVLAAGLKGQC